MKIILRAGLNGFIRLEQNTANIPEQVTVKAEPTIQVGHLVLACRHPSGYATFDLDREADITSICGMSGTVYMVLENYVEGRKQNEWQVEPLNIVKNDVDISAIPAITELTKRLTEAEKSLTTIKTALAEIYKMIKE